MDWRTSWTRLKAKPNRSRQVIRHGWPTKRMAAHTTPGSEEHTHSLAMRYITISKGLTWFYGS